MSLWKRLTRRVLPWKPSVLSKIFLPLDEALGVLDETLESFVSFLQMKALGSSCSKIIAAYAPYSTDLSMKACPGMVH